MSIGKVLHRPRAYDLVVWLHTRGGERRFRERLVQLAGVGPGESVLDVGCGTGALAIAAAARVGPGGRVFGIDPSAEMVARARRKAQKAGVEAGFDTAGVQALPFPDATFDVVLSTLMLHHLTAEGRRQGLHEVARVLTAGGRFLVVDTGGAQGKHSHLAGLRKHAPLDVEALRLELEEAGLAVVEEGPVEVSGMSGLSGLGFVLATATNP